MPATSTTSWRWNLQPEDIREGRLIAHRSRFGVLYQITDVYPEGGFFGGARFIAMVLLEEDGSAPGRTGVEMFCPSEAGQFFTPAPSRVRAYEDAWGLEPLES